MTFKEILAEVIDWLRQDQRISYRALKRQFELDDEYLEDLKIELIEIRECAIDRDNKMLVWTGGRHVMPEAVSPPVAPNTTSDKTTESEREPLSYTPPHLTEKILTSRSALEGERKQVTVLFCDLSNSTPLAERIGPENMHALLNRFFELALNEVHRYEGTINQFLGDGFMALFGAPIAHEDHARRAALASLALRQRLYADPSPLGQLFDVHVEFRMGLHTGLVIVGAIGDNLRMDYTAIGDTTNVASRLQNMANPGQIIISETTHRLAEGYCTTQALGELTLKGKTEPIRAWEVLAVRESRTRLEVEAERGLTPFVGRERELQILMDGFAQAQEGHGQIVFVTREAGLGKSRLLREFREQIEDTEATWLEGHCLSFWTTDGLSPDH
ncbi:hypothetical protein C2W62_32545 [Candidatus Entotheonella serta]|nr:hypothetical protein C2W62_32545 [Candidatus Entotheonella serta]